MWFSVRKPIRIECQFRWAIARVNWSDNRFELRQHQRNSALRTQLFLFLASNDSANSNEVFYNIFQHIQGYHRRHLRLWLQLRLCWFRLRIVFECPKNEAHTPSTKCAEIIFLFCYCVRICENIEANHQRRTNHTYLWSSSLFAGAVANLISRVHFTFRTNWISFGRFIDFEIRQSPVVIARVVDLIEIDLNSS